MTHLTSSRIVTGQRVNKSKFLAPSALAVVLLLGGCASIQPEPISKEEIKATAVDDLAAIRVGVTPVTNGLTLEEAVARAIKFNTERRVRAMEEAFASGQLEAGKFEMLPKLVASAGYHKRSNDLITRSTNSVTGAPSLSDPYISSERGANTTDLNFTWSLLDFGQSYYASKQNADRALITIERRRKATHLIIQDVRTAFWRAASAQKLKASVQETIAAAEDALADSRKSEAERLRNPLDALRYQRQLLENLRLLEAIDQELSVAKIELAALINVPLVQSITIIEPAGSFGSKWLETPIEELESLAIAQNPDLREAHYSARISQIETRRTMARLFPGLSFNYAVRGSNDSYLINQHWNDVGLQVSMNLLGLLSLPANRQLAEASKDLAEYQRMASLMRVMTQVHLARQQLGNAVRLFERAEAIANVDATIADHAAKRESVQTMTKLDRVANQTSFILSQLRRYQALAQVYASSSKLQATIGLDPVTDGSSDMPLEELTQKVKNTLQQWGELQPGPTAPAPAPEPVPAAPVAPT